MVKRKNRNKFFYENGVGNYDFNFNKEIRKYIFLCGEKMTRKQWKLLQEDEKFYAYEEWKSYIENKYSNYPVNGLREFSRYLNHMLRKTLPTKEFISPYASAILSCVLTFYVAEISNIGFGNSVMLVVLFIILIFLCFSIGYLVIKLVQLFWHNSIKECFYKDYKEIIDNIIKEKV